jgi:hypothetical protein
LANLYQDLDARIHDIVRLLRDNGLKHL